MKKTFRFLTIWVLSFVLVLTYSNVSLLRAATERPVASPAASSYPPDYPTEQMPPVAPASGGTPTVALEPTPDTESLPPTADESEDSQPSTAAPETETPETDAPQPAEEEATADAEPEVLSEDDWFQRELLVEADRLYLAGDIKGAESLYREAKTYGWRDDSELADIPPDPFSDEAALSPAAAVYWREAARGIETGRESQTLVSLGLLAKEHPAFLPGHLRYAEQLVAYDRGEAAAAALQEALTLYPSNPELLQAQIQLMLNQEQWIEASIAARQFALLNPEHPQAAAYTTLATENLERFKTTTRQQIRNNAIANVLTGVAGYVLTGGLYGPFTALNSTIALLQGEEALGAQVANQAREQLPILEDEPINAPINAYIDRIGQKLAASAGRDEFEYEFDVILDKELNAFALPGGKVFVNAGAILDTDSEAELAGLLAHEISHAVLSHGFQLVTQGNLTASITQYLPLPGLVTNLLVSGYSRQMERQADIVGTQILASSSYAADGMHGLMLALNDRYGDRDVPTWLSTHPAPRDRVDYLQAIVERGGYNRYAYEGVATHEEIQALTAKALEDYEAEQKEEEAGTEEEVDEAVEEVKEEQAETTDPTAPTPETSIPPDVSSPTN